MKRNIINIDEEKCNGCGLCIPDCPEGALKIVDGKVRLVKELLCDGLGACIGKCPAGALSIEQRDADEFDEQQAKKNMEHASPHHGCPGMAVMQWDKQPEASAQPVDQKSALRQWPIELKLLNPRAPYFHDADLVVAADCVPFSYPNFHSRFLNGKTLVIFCPKLDNAHEEYVSKMVEIFTVNTIRSVTVAHMEVPCCSATTQIVEEALRRSGRQIVLKDYTVSIRGEII